MCSHFHQGPLQSFGNQGQSLLLARALIDGRALLPDQHSASLGHETTVTTPVQTLPQSCYQFLATSLFYGCADPDVNAHLGCFYTLRGAGAAVCRKDARRQGHGPPTGTHQKYLINEVTKKCSWTR